MRSPKQQVLKCLNYFGPQNLSALSDNMKKRNYNLTQGMVQQTLEELVEHKKVRCVQGVFESKVRIGGEEE